MKKLVIFSLILCLLPLTGCWDMREINEIGLVMAVGVDYRCSDTNKYIVTVQMANPSGGSKDEGKGSADNKVWVSSGEGETIFEAIRDLTKVASKRIMWAHNNLIIVGEELAKKDITSVVDFFTHNQELRMKTGVAVSHGEAKKYLNAKIGSGNIAGLEISKLFRYQKLTGKSVFSEMLGVYSDFTNEDAHSLITGIKFRRTDLIPEGPEQTQDLVELSGAAIFNHSKMVGWLSEEETRGLNWVSRGIDDTVVSVQVEEDKNSTVAIEVSNIKSKINSYVTDEIPNFTISVSGKARIVEEDKSLSLTLDELKNKVEKLANNKIKDEITLGINKSQKEYKSDVLDLKKVLHIQHKKEWNKKYKSVWNELFPNVPIKVTVDIDITSSSLNQIPANYK